MKKKDNVDLLAVLLKECEVILLGRKKYTFLGIMSINFKKTIKYFTEHDLPDNFKLVEYVCDVTMNTKRITVTVKDGEFKYPIQKEQRNIVLHHLVHSLLHLISRHYTRKGNRIPEVWNVACDHVVNSVQLSMMNSGLQSEMPKNAVFFKDIYEEDPNYSVEDIYERILNEKVGTSNRFVIEYLESPSGKKYIKVTDLKTGKETIINNDTDPDPEDGQSDEDMLEEFDGIEQQALRTWHSGAIQKGNMPGQVIDYLENIMRIEVPWEKIFENAVLYNTQALKKRTWTEPNFYLRRFAKTPGNCNKNRGLRYLIFCLDTSGSMLSAEILEKALGVVVSSIDHYHGLIFMQHDTRVVFTKVFNKKPSVAEIMDTVGTVRGGGGTSHNDAFEKIGEIVDEANVSTVIFFTDCESDIESCYKEHAWLKDFCTIWLVPRKTTVDLGDCETNVISI